MAGKMKSSYKLKLPELPPNYSVHRSSDGWWIYNGSDIFDGEDPIERREDAVTRAWELYYDFDCDAAWRAVFKAIGAP